MRKPNYDKFPATKIDGKLFKGWEAIVSVLKKELQDHKVLTIETYTGVHDKEILSALESIVPDLLLKTTDLFKPEEEVLKMTASFITEDVLFGYVTNLEIQNYFDQEKLKAAQAQLALSKTVIIYGPGASLLSPSTASHIYIDMARWEIIQRMRRSETPALGIDNSGENISLQHKRGYFNDWRVLDRHKDSLYTTIDYWIDSHIPGDPKMIDQATFMSGIEKTVNGPFRVVPFFDTAPWGGQWMKEVCDLDKSKVNYGWCFDCVPEENSLLLNIDGTLFEMPSINVVKMKSSELLGSPVEARFGKDFPIRFDFLDTYGGGNLSLQVHPTTQFIQENFGLQYTQDESYYMLDANPEAVVYLGFKNGVDKDEMMADLKKAALGELVFDAEKYVNKFPAKKHDHFLIPAGTIHCSGSEGLVLEISATPNLFTFKLWDWERLGLDGKPRPINVDRGSKVLNWERDKDYTLKQLINVFSPVQNGDGWIEEKTGLHQNQFIETRRHRFSKKTPHHSGNGVNVLNLVEGEEAIVESPTGKFEPFIVHYAETFIIPAKLGDYTIAPYGKSLGKECITIKAYVRF